MDNFIYNVPDFSDFTIDLINEDVLTAEAFFDIEHESHNGKRSGSNISVEESERYIDQEFYTPLKLTPETKNGEKCLKNNLRRSLSMGDLTKSDEALPDKLYGTSAKMENLHISSNQRKRHTDQKKKVHTMNTRADIPKLNLRSRSISRDRIDQLAQPKSKMASRENLTVKAFVSMAEAINQFQHKTPKRFHTKSKTEPNEMTKFYGPLPNTVPQSPALCTKQRIRPTYVLSREEIEIKEYEEIKKFKIKANPVSAKVLNGPVQPKIPVPKKPVTIPEPFRLTQNIIKKEIVSPRKTQTFHAKPVPKAVLEAPKPILKSNLITIPHTPKLMKRYTHDKTKNKGPAEIKPEAAEQPLKLETTKLVPFSFDERNKEILKKREKYINEIFEEEKKAREFHARPLPKAIFKPSPRYHNSDSSLVLEEKQAAEFHARPLPKTPIRPSSRLHNSDTSLHSNIENMPESNVFKARPAKVLHMQPFVPKKPERQLVEISEFELNTQRRAKERDEFEQKIRDRQEKIAQIVKQNQEELLRRELEEAARFRKETEYKAQPIRRYKPAKPVAAKQLTDPVSPNFSQYKNVSKENFKNNMDKSLF